MGPTPPRHLAVCSRSFSASAALRAAAEERFPAARFNDSGQVLADEALVAFLDGSTHAIVGLERIDAALLDRAPALRVVSKYGVGIDAIDEAALKSRGVRLAHTPGVNRRAVAELVIAQAIALLRRTTEATLATRAGRWQSTVGRELGAATVGIVGCGNVGKEVVRLLAPFGARVLAHDRVSYADFYAAHGVEATSLDSLLERSDVVTLHVPLDASTRGLLDARRIARMRPGAVLLNLARGGIVDEAALATALEDGRLAGAALDVFHREPPAPSRLLDLPNVLCTPHMAASTEQAVRAMGEAALRGLDEDARAGS